jgi:hypothetical protein
MRKKCYKFLWTGRRAEEGIPLVKWDRIAKPKELGGWGLKNLYVFNQALVAKSLWRMLFNKGLWGKVMKEKYLENKEVEAWLRQERKYFKGASNIWKGLVKAYDILGHWVAWKIRRGMKLIVGKDPWIGCSGNYRLSEPLQHALQLKELHV